MKLEWPIFTSTSPLLLLRPITMRFWRIIYSKSLPSKRAIAAPFGSGLHARLDGLAGADFRANNAQASLSEGFCNVDMARIAAHQNGCLAKAKQGYPVPAVYIKLLPGMHRASHVASFLPACDRGRNGTVKWPMDPADLLRGSKPRQQSRSSWPPVLAKLTDAGPTLAQSTLLSGKLWDAIFRLSWWFTKLSIIRFHYLQCS